MGTVHKPGKLPAFAALLLLLAIFGSAWLFDRLRRPAADPALASIAGPVQGAASATGPILQVSGDERCLEPRFGEPARASDRPAPREWRIAGGGDRLQEDACGHVWALWFNSWTIYRHGQTEQAGYLSLSGATGSIAGLARSGVQSFLPGPGADLWLLGNYGDLAHYRNGAWESLPARRNCGQGQLALVDGSVWLACGYADAPSLSAWDATSRTWQAVPGHLKSVERITKGPDGLVYAIDGERIVERRSGPGGDGWQLIAKTSGSTTAFAVDRERIYHGGSDGLRIFDRRGKLLTRAFEGKAITGVAPNGRGGAWVSVSGAGLHYFHGERWSSWRYAQGLPDDEARDVLIDARGWLWVGGSRSAVLDERTAAARIVELATPDALPGLLFDDACAAVRTVLGDRAQSGQVAQDKLAGRALVFFAGRQVCPFPQQQASDERLFFRRGNDGALLEVPTNGSRGEFSCGVPCGAHVLAHLEPLWTVTVHAPPRDRVIAPPSPVPTQSPSDTFLLSRRGDIWLATRDLGVYRHDGERWHHYGEKDGFGPGNIVQAMLEDAEGFVWIASSPQYLPEKSHHAGATLQQWVQGEWRRYTPDDGLAYWSGQALAPVPGGVAIGTNGGLSVVKQSGVVTVDTKQPGGSNFISAIALDKSGTWWLAHGSFGEGLSIGRDGDFGRLTSRTGLFEDRLVAIALDDLGNVWLIAENGKVAVYPRAMLLERARISDLSVGSD